MTDGAVGVIHLRGMPLARISLIALALGAVCGLACGGDEDSPNCKCFSQGASDNLCEPEPLCAPIAVQCSEDLPLYDCPLESLTTDSAGAIDCTLAAIQGAGVGEVSWTVEGIPGSHQELFFSLPGDGTAFRWGRLTREPDYEVWPAVHLELETVAYFQGCAARATPVERFVCLREGQRAEPFKDCAVGFFGQS